MGDFSLSMNELLKQVNGNVENVVKKSVFDLTSAIIKDTPTDTSRAKNNWLISFNTPIDDVSNKLDANGNVAISEASQKIFNNKVPMVYWIQNNLPYIERLEYGWSKQSPNGMVRINILRFNQFFKDNTK
jgi:hypothetical protein